jgi:hypothetical protein
MADDKEKFKTEDAELKSQLEALARNEAATIHWTETTTISRVEKYWKFNFGGNTSAMYEHPAVYRDGAHFCLFNNIKPDAAPTGLKLVWSLNKEKDS